MGRIRALVQYNFDGDPLDYLDIVSCCILRWQKGEDSSCSCLDTLNLPMKYFIRIGIYYYFHFLSWFDPLQLGFFIIGSDPDIIERNNGQ